ncbi:MAG: sugar kinase [Armatimonadota bacterium]|nr:sugar kinase [bacterium]
MSQKAWSIVSLGEPLLRLAPPTHIQIARTASFDVQVAGSQFNVAANSARLGARSTFVTKLPANQLGQLVLEAARAHGVDTRHMQLIPGSRMGLTFVEFSSEPRAPVAVYDRAKSAASSITPDDFDWESIVAGVDVAYTDGIFPGLSPNCEAACVAYVNAAKRAGCRVCFDTNYREHLWDTDKARAAFVKILPFVDVIVVSRTIAEIVFGSSGTDEEIMRSFNSEFGCEMVLFTSREMDGLRRGGWSSKALYKGSIVQSDPIQFEIADRYGTGDAWFSGVIHGLVTHDIEYALDFGNALCALAHTILGDVASFSAEEVEAIMGGRVDLRVKR